MKLVFDSRVLTHKTYTGIENYTKNILQKIQEKYKINIVKPKVTNKYLAHFWVHFILPFKKGDLLFCPANIAPVFVPKSKKLVITIHDVAFLTYPKSFSRLFRIYYKMIIPINISRANKIITVSQYSKKEIIKFYPRAKTKIKVINLGFDKQFKKIDAIRKKEQLLYVGSMNERKNYKAILSVFDKINNTNLKLLMVGNFSENFALDSYSIRLLEKAKTNSNIEFKSNIADEDLLKIYNESQLFIFPSFYEGFGLPVLEAMACGTPVITSNTTSLPEVGGDAVVYCDPCNIEDIKEGIEIILNDNELQKKMIEKGLKRAKQFSWEKSAKEHICIFNEVFKK